jgi:hypothetical protein
LIAARANETAFFFLFSFFLQERLTCKQAMAHPYFAPVREAEAQQQQQQGMEEETQVTASDEEQPAVSCD